MTLTLHLEGATQYERFENVESFVGEDASGSFGLLPGHARFMTVLEFGLARFRAGGGGWQYVAAPGAVLSLAGDELHLSARRYLRGADFARISAALREQLAAEERSLGEIRHSVRRLEGEMLKRLWQLGREGEEMP